VAHGVGDNVADVLVDESVNRFTTTALRRHDPGAAQDPQVLRNERLAHFEVIDELVDTARPLPQLDHDSQAGRSGQHLQQLAGDLVGLVTDNPRT